VRARRVLLLTAAVSLPPLMDAVTGAAPDADLTRPLAYVVFAPAVDTFDALTFLSLGARKAVDHVGAGTRAWGALRRGTGARAGASRLIGAGTGAAHRPSAPFCCPARARPGIGGFGATVTTITPHRRVARRADDPRRLGRADLARWHAVQGFGRVLRHRLIIVFQPRITHADSACCRGDRMERLYQQHIVALGETRPLDRHSIPAGTPGDAEAVRACSPAGGAAMSVEFGITWEHHREDLDQFVAAGRGRVSRS